MRVEVRDRPSWSPMWSETAAIASGRRGRQAGRAHRLDRDDLTGERGLHVHHAVAVDGPVDQGTRERLGDTPTVGHGFRVHVPREDHRRAVPEGDVPDGVGAVPHHRLQLDVLERRLAHHRREERRQVALLAEDARDTADLLHEVHRSPEVERAQHALRDERRSRPYIHFGSSGSSGRSRAAVRQVLVGRDRARIWRAGDELVRLHPVAVALPVRRRRCSRSWCRRRGQQGRACTARSRQGTSGRTA